MGAVQYHGVSARRWSVALWSLGLARVGAALLFGCVLGLAVHVRWCDVCVGLALL